MHLLRILIVLCASFLLWMACTRHDNERPSLSDALHAVDEHPKEALTLLESIENPEQLFDCKQDQYMQYIVILTQARYMNDQNITGDSLILDAQRYFAASENIEMAVRASYYAGAYWYECEVGDKAAEYWQAAFSFAERAGNKLFTGKSAYALGMSYFIQRQWEDALPYSQKALAFYNDLPNSGYYKLGITEMLGQIHWRLKEPEQASRYFDDGLKMAKDLKDASFEARFLRNKGLLYRDKGVYGEAKAYFDQALSIQPDQDDQLRIYLSYAILFRDMNRPDSTFHYLSLIEKRIPEIKYPNSRRDMYQELVTYYTSNYNPGRGDGEKIALYSELAHKESLRIKTILNEKKIIAINLQLEQIKQKNLKTGQVYQRMYDYGLIALFVLASLLIIFWVHRHEMKKKYQQNRQLLFSQTLDLQHLLLGGLRSVAKSTDDLHQKNLAYAGSPVWEQQLVLLEKFSTQIAEYTRHKLETLPNGNIALLKLTLEDLSIMHLSRMRIPDETIGWMLGYKGEMKEPIVLRKKEILQILTEAQIRQRDIKTFLP